MSVFLSWDWLKLACLTGHERQVPEEGDRFSPAIPPAIHHSGRGECIRLTADRQEVNPEEHKQYGQVGESVLPGPSRRLKPWRRIMYIGRKEVRAPLTRLDHAGHPTLLTVTSSTDSAPVSDVDGLIAKAEFFMSVNGGPWKPYSGSRGASLPFLQLAEKGVLTWVGPPNTVRLIQGEYISKMAPGKYSLKVVAIDDHGASTTSTPVRIVVGNE